MVTKVKMEILGYRAEPGIPGFGDKEAEIFGIWTAKVTKKLGRPLQTHEVVEMAKSRNCPIHILLEWNDKKAADEHRKQQVRAMNNHLIVVYDDDGEEKELKARYSVRAVVVDEDGEESEIRGYEVEAEVLSDEDYKKQVIAEALHRLNSFRKKYKDIKEIMELVDADAFNRAMKKYLK